MIAQAASFRKGFHRPGDCGAKIKEGDLNLFPVRKLLSAGKKPARTPMLEGIVVEFDYALNYLLANIPSYVEPIPTDPLLGNKFGKLICIRTPVVMIGNRIVLEARRLHAVRRQKAVFRQRIAHFRLEGGAQNRRIAAFALDMCNHTADSGYGRWAKKVAVFEIECKRKTLLSPTITDGI